MQVSKHHLGLDNIPHQEAFYTYGKGDILGLSPQEVHLCEIKIIEIELHSCTAYFHSSGT